MQFRWRLQGHCFLIGMAFSKAGLGSQVSRVRKERPRRKIICNTRFAFGANCEASWRLRKGKKCAAIASGGDRNSHPHQAGRVEA